jgi:hypothetical protein
MEDRLMDEDIKKAHCIVQYYKHVKEVDIADKYRAYYNALKETVKLSNKLVWYQI